MEDPAVKDLDPTPALCQWGRNTYVVSPHNTCQEPRPPGSLLCGKDDVYTLYCFRLYSQVSPSSCDDYSTYHFHVFPYPLPTYPPADPPGLWGWVSTIISQKYAHP